VAGWRQARSGRAIPCISSPPGDFFAGIFPYRIRDFKNNAEFCNISLGMDAELFHIVPVSETNNQPSKTMKTTKSTTIAYLAYLCGRATVREMGTDKVLAVLVGKRTYDQHAASAVKISKRNGWVLK
jgi:hypothetical protein